MTLILATILLAGVLFLAFALGRRSQHPRSPLPAAQLSVPEAPRPMTEPEIIDRLAAHPLYKNLDEDTRLKAARSIHRAASRLIPGARPREVTRGA